MIVLGVDPGFSVTGFGIAQQQGNKIVLIDYGFLKLPSTYSLAQRIGLFHTFFTNKIQEWKVAAIALETPFLGKNAQNFLKLGYLRGILYLLADTHQLTLHEFSPTEVKKAVTGFGGAQKDQVARVILRLFPNLISPEKADVTDALAVMLCGIWQTKTKVMSVVRKNCS